MGGGLKSQAVGRKRDAYAKREAKKHKGNAGVGGRGGVNKKSGNRGHLKLLDR